MSKAGVESSIGDEYQTLVAAFWAIQMLTDNAIDKIEIDSTSLAQQGTPYGVDDIIIYKDGTLICCQCKKNQPKFSTWKTEDLKSELEKAWCQWERAPDTQFMFYSRSDFGELAMLSERSRVMPDTHAFLAEFPKRLKKEYASLKKKFEIIDAVLPASDENIFKFIRQISFETLPDKTLRQMLGATLLQHVTHAENAFNIILHAIDRVARRSASPSSGIQHYPNSITKKDLIQLLNENGHLISPQNNEQELLSYFTTISSRGRFWPREIRGKRLQRQEEHQKLLRHIDIGTKLVLLDGEPGSGKTCVLLELLDEIEKRKDIFTIFIQTREINHKDFSEHSDEFIGKIARLSEIKKVVLLADSLDVLSISEAGNSFSVFLSLLHKAKSIPNVTIITACRTFDIKYDSRISAIDWSDTVTLEALDFSKDIVPFLELIGIDHTQVEVGQKKLLQNPRMLSMYVDICGTGKTTKAATIHELAESYLHTIILDDLGLEAYSKVKHIAAVMLHERTLSITKIKAQLNPELSRKLLSANIIFETEQGNFAFAHQTVVDILAVANAEENSQTLTDFILALKPVPFVRPSVRTFFFYLRTHDHRQFRKQVRAALNSTDIAFHLKRLIFASLGEVIPDDEDWPLVRHMFYEHLALFETFFLSADIDLWFDFFQSKLFPEFKASQNAHWILRYANRLTSWSNLPPQTFIQIWKYVVECEFIKEDAALQAYFALNKFTSWSEPGFDELFEQIIQRMLGHNKSVLGKELSRWVDHTNEHDDILWRYITRNIDMNKGGLDSEIDCKPHTFYEDGFLCKRMQNSEKLLSIAVNYIEEWSLTIDASRGESQRHGGHFLYITSFSNKRSRGDMRHMSSAHMLFFAIEEACLVHAQKNSFWWQSHVEKLIGSNERAFQYIAILGLAANPQPYINLIVPLLVERMRENNGYPFEYELGQLLHSSAYYLNDKYLGDIQAAIAHSYKDELNEESWVLRSRRNIFIEIPAPFRLPSSQATIDYAEKIFGPPYRKPPITSTGGFVSPPIAHEDLASLSDAGILSLLHNYGETERSMDWEDSSGILVGGADMVASELRNATSKNPERFFHWGKKNWCAIRPLFRDALLSGLAEHVSYRFGNVRPANNAWEPSTAPSAETLLQYLLDIIENKIINKINEHTLSRVFDACAYIAQELTDIERVCFIIIPCAVSISPSSKEEDTDYATTGLNSVRGILADAVSTLVDRCLEKENPHIPDILLALLNRFSRDEHPAVRVMILRHLPYIISRDKSLGWSIFDKIVELGPSEIWKHAYNCLYYNYYNDFSKIKQYLQQIETNGMPEGGKVWGAIWALAYLSNKLELPELLERLQRVDNSDSWGEAARVFSHNITSSDTASKCINALESILHRTSGNVEVIREAKHIFFDKNGKYFSFPISLVTSIFSYMATVDSEQNISLFHFPEWLLNNAEKNYDDALELAEIFTEKALDTYIGSTESQKFSKLLTQFFREAEERENVDGGEMLHRVINLQDTLLKKGVYQIEEWLKEAERP